MKTPNVGSFYVEVRESVRPTQTLRVRLVGIAVALKPDRPWQGISEQKRSWTLKVGSSS